MTDTPEPMTDARLDEIIHELDVLKEADLQEELELVDEARAALETSGAARLGGGAASEFTLTLVSCLSCEESQ